MFVRPVAGILVWWQLSLEKERAPDSEDVAQIEAYRVARKELKVHVDIRHGLARP